MQRTTERSVTSIVETAQMNNFALRFTYEHATGQKVMSVHCSGNKIGNAPLPSPAPGMMATGTGEVEIRVSVTPDNKIVKSINFNNVDIDGQLANAIVAECITILEEETV